ncbi:GNAT family N-acetyltransferase [Cellulomonas sp. KRMCY2]|uniref:GNAT family N-acetyltransferase n=1 Tax=Cellulomonas sp. KRMCY2 TaxID=1304865 RepID=UPI00045EBC15|nr:GNAT family protein [Cellulomonas sp. KRMCY2]
MEHAVTLSGHGLRLEPLALGHAEALVSLVDDGVWAGTTSPTPRDAAHMTGVIRTALETPDRYAFAVLDAGTAEVRGSTSFYDVLPAQQRCEIGHTFYGRQWWGGRTNPACKYLLLSHAFDTWGMHRVALRADARNVRSTGAMRRLGAVPEGVLRGHRIAADGSRADTVYFSVLAPEWPAVRDGLLARLAV